MIGSVQLDECSQQSPGMSSIAAAVMPAGGVNTNPHIDQEAACEPRAIASAAGAPVALARPVR